MLAHRALTTDNMPCGMGERKEGSHGAVGENEPDGDAYTA